MLLRLAFLRPTGSQLFPRLSVARPPLFFFFFVSQMLQAQDGVCVGGTYRYHPRTYPAVGEGLVLEEASLMPSRQSIRLLAEQNEVIQSASNPTAGVRKMLTEGVIASGLGVVMSPPLPPDMTTATEVRERMDR